jgi:adenylate cyclase
VVLYVVGDVVLASGDVLVAQYLRLLSTLVRQHLLTRRQAHLTKYFSPNVVRLILERDPQTDIDCEPRVAKATSFFFDVRGSSLPLAASAEERSRLYVELRQVLSVVTDAVFATGGTIIDYAGDGVFAVWGVPRAQMDQADRAVGCALRVLHSLQGARFVTLGTPAQLCGIGIASGEVLVGSVGSSVMFKYGVFGPSVSVAQRLAMLTKPDALDRPILISDDVQRELGRYQRGVRYVGQVPLRGMDSIVEAFEVLPGTAHDAADEWQH